MVGRHRRRGEDGTAALEFGLVVPILVLVVLGIANLGFVFAQQISMTNIARQAARTAVVGGTSAACSAVKTGARTDAETIGMPATSIPTPSVAPCPASGPVCAGSTPGTNVTVTVTRNATWVIPFPPLFSSATAPTLESKGVMRCEIS